MGFLTKVHLSCFLFSYIAAFGGELFRLLRRNSTFTRAVLVFAATAGLVAHTAYLVNRSWDSGLPPLVGSSHDWLLVLAWLVAALYLLVVSLQTRTVVSPFILPPLIGLVLMAVFVDSTTSPESRETASHRWAMLHAATLVIGMGTVAAATLCAYLYLLQFQKLRGKSSWMHRFQLPSLEQLTTLNRSLVITTVVMLTIGLVTGVILGSEGMRKEAPPFDWTDPLVVATTILWTVLVGYLGWLLTKKEQTGRQVARLTLIAGGFLLLTIFGLILISGGLHGGDENKANVAEDSA